MQTDERDDVARQVEAMETLGAVIRWATTRTPRGEFVNVVVQDEYTHDVVVRVAPELFAVFDTT